MTKKKKIAAGLAAAVLFGAAVTGAAVLAKKASAQEILVVPVESIYTETFQETSSLSGTITTSVSQNVKLEDDAIIQEVYVKKGDRVKKGDKLLTLDMTLKELELDIAKLTRESQELQLEKAQEKLESLQNGDPIEEEPVFQITPEPEEEPEDSDKESGGASAASYGSAERAGAVSLKFFPQSGSGMFLTVSQTEGLSEKGDISEEEDIPLEPDDGTPSEDNPNQEEAVFYTVLDFDSEPYCGEGTKEDPFVFLCSHQEEEIILKGSFFNKMAGYDAQGQELEKEGGYWFRLGFFENDEAAETADLILSSPFDGSSFELQHEDAETVFSVKGMSMEDHEEEENRLEEEPETDSPDGEPYFPEEEEGETPGDTSSLSREEAIEQQQTTIEGLKLDIKESKIKISKLEKELDKKTVTSTINGTVKSVGDPETGSYSGAGFITIESDKGYYVQGTVSELQRDKLKPGQTVSGIAYESGAVFAAVIDEVSDYPVSSQSYYETGNTNVSYYSFLAEIPDTSIQLKLQEYVNITLDAAMGDGDGSIRIAKAFVISENGKDYIYKDDNGVLKKVQVTVGTSDDGGYSVPVNGDLTLEDKLAFPYGKGVKEGAKTKEGSIDDLYGIY